MLREWCRPGETDPRSPQLHPRAFRHPEDEALQPGGADDLVFCHPETGGPFDASKMRKRFKDAIKAPGPLDDRDLRRLRP